MITTSNNFNMNYTYHNNANKNNNKKKNNNHFHQQQQQQQQNRNHNQKMNSGYFNSNFNNNNTNINRMPFNKQNSFNELIKQSLSQPGLLANPPAALNPGLLTTPSTFLHSDNSNIQLFNNINLNNNNQSRLPINNISPSKIQTRQSSSFNNNNNNNNFQMNTKQQTFQQMKKQQNIIKSAPIPMKNSNNIKNSLRILNQNSKQKQQQQQPIHAYNTRFNANRSKFFKSANGGKQPMNGTLMNSAVGKIKKDKNTAPYNTTQYIMYDYSKRLTGDASVCDQSQNDSLLSSAEQQFTDDWNMAEMSSSPASDVFSDSHFIKIGGGGGSSDKSSTFTCPVSKSTDSLNILKSSNSNNKPRAHQDIGEQNEEEEEDEQQVNMSLDLAKDDTTDEVAFPLSSSL